MGYYYFNYSPSVVCASLDLVSVNEKREQPINQVFVAFPSVKVLRLSCWYPSFILLQLFDFPSAELSLIYTA